MLPHSFSTAIGIACFEPDDAEFEGTDDFLESFHFLPQSVAMSKQALNAQKSQPAQESKTAAECKVEEFIGHWGGQRRL